MYAVTRFLLEENGQGFTEYALILSILVVSAVVAMGSVGSKVSNLFQHLSAQIN